MSVIPCQKNKRLRRLIEEYVEALKTEAHKLGTHGLGEAEFYNSGIYRGAIERARGQFSATMREKKQFVRHVLNYMEDQGFIQGWDSASERNRHDYVVRLRTGRVAAIELKGCLDGNNTNIFVRPAHADEFILWSVCTNPSADPRLNAWSGLHTRLSAEIVSRGERVDGLVVWDMACGTVGRPCPKMSGLDRQPTSIGPFSLPPPCIYVFPAAIPTSANPSPAPQPIASVGILQAFQDCFHGREEDVNYVEFEVSRAGADIVRRTRVRRAGDIVKESQFTAIQRA